MSDVSVSEIHRYPLRPPGFEKPLFLAPDPKRVVAQHLLEAPWLRRAYKAGERTGEVPHAEFFCALLNSQPGGFYSPTVLLNEAERIGLSGYLPDLHLSGEDFTIEEGGRALWVKLSYCKGISEAAMASVFSEREKKPFYSVTGLHQGTLAHKGSLENLAKAGSSDSLLSGRGDRRRLMEEARRLPKRRRNDRQSELPVPHPAYWWESRESGRAAHLPLTKTQRERVGSETLGLNVRRHPLVTYRRALRDLGAVPSERITHLPHVARVRAAGLIECLQGPATKSGKPVWFLLLEDERGYLQATILRAVYVEYGELLHHGAAVVLEGRVEQDRRWGFSFLVERVADLLKVLAGAKTSSPKAATAPRTFLTAKSHSRRAG